jgi:ribosomal-protein-alanine N-acetyltransferase
MRIKCDRCILRGWEISDIDSLVENANNYRIAVNMRDLFPHPYTIEDAKTWIEITNNNETKCNFAITVNDQAIGAIGLALGEDIERISAEVGYWLGEKYWGTGITSSALKGIVNYGFNDLGLKRIFAKPFEHNMASRRVLEKNGFYLEGILKRSAFKEGKIYNQALYAVTQ